MKLTPLFCLVDDFCKNILPEFRKRLIGDGKKSRVRKDCLLESEIITMLIWFNLSGFKCFKHFYLSCKPDLQSHFPRISCYERFVILQKKSFIWMNLFLRFLTEKTAQKTDVYYITVFGQLKDFRHLVHKKYRSRINYFTNVLAALLAYMLNPSKPKICLNRLGVA